MRVDILVLSTENDDGNPKWIEPSVGAVLYAREVSLCTEKKSLLHYFAENSSN